MNNVPLKDSGYILSSKSNCNNGVTVSWEDSSWTAVINYTNYVKETSSKTKCNLYFEKGNFSQKNKEYLLSKAVDGQIIEDDETQDHNLRYIGADPNNYVSFNNELWRIIGVMNNVDDGTGTKETRIKLIRNEEIGQYSWDTSASGVNEGWGVNEWSQSDIKKIIKP